MACPINVPPYPPIPDGATLEQREKMYEDWCRELARNNPSYFHADGRRRGVVSQIVSTLCGVKK